MNTFLQDPVIQDPLLSTAGWMVVKATVLLGVIAVVQAAFHRRSSAAMRHLIWTLAIVALILMPVLSLALPEWAVMVRTVSAPPASGQPGVERVDEPAPPLQATDAAGAAVSPSVTRPATDISWTRVMAGVYAAGLLIMLMQIAVQRWSVRRLAREASDVHDPEWTRLLSDSAAAMGIRRLIRLVRSRERSMPMAFGTRQPTILIPAVADTWLDERRRAVVLHELAHVARYDCLTQSLAFVACALYWFHPMVWWVSRRLRVERELACDDRVILAGAPARDYAGHLLEIAYAVGRHRAPALAVGMARRQQLEGRLLAVLDAARNRRLPSWHVRAASIAIAVAVILPLASVTTAIVEEKPPVEHPPASATASPAPQDVPRLDPSLKPLSELVTGSVATAGRAVRAAAARFGMQDGLPGTWEIRPTKMDGTVHLRIAEGNSSSGRNLPIQTLEGLTSAQLTGAGGPVQFRLRRDAGTFTFEGVLRNGVGAGTFSFAPNPAFPAELAKRGFARPTAREQYQMARHDVGFALIDELNKQGYGKPETSELVRAGQHGVDATYVREMGALGYRLGTLAPLIELRDHGVGPDYVRDLADLGYKGLSANELRRARDHGISREFAQGMREAGYGSLPMDQLITARDHGVSPEYIRELGDAGHRKLPLEQVIRVRDHGVSAEYAREMRQLGYGVPIDELVRARDHGVSVEFVRELSALGYGSLPLDGLIRIRDHGVTPGFVRELKELGYDKVPMDDLVTLRDHGITAERIRAANARAGTRLPLDMLRSFVGR
jgi:beta-lactamase regulating signal transducer with metallopeptidase domain